MDALCPIKDLILAIYIHLVFIVLQLLQYTTVFENKVCIWKFYHHCCCFCVSLTKAKACQTQDTSMFWMLVNAHCG